MKELKFFDIENVLDEYPNTTAYVIVGQRGVGKSYSIKKHILNHYIKTGKKFIYLRRWTTDITPKNLMTVFDDVLGKEKFKFPKTEEYDSVSVLPKGSNFYVVGYKEGKKPEYLYDIGRISCVALAEKFKGGTYNDYNRIFFDEFITERAYITGDKEPEQLNKILNTVARVENEDVKLFMAGNPDSQIEMCPYLYDMHLDYENMQENTVFAYNSLGPDNVLRENTKVFIKLAKLGADYLNLNFYGIWGQTSEDVMSIDGSVKINHYIQSTDEMLDNFNPFYEMEVETAIIRKVVGNDKFFRSIYVYAGTLYGEPMLYISNHKRFDVVSLFCRYDPTVFKDRGKRQIYRIEVPSIEEYKDLLKILNVSIQERNIMTKDDAFATLFENIYESTRMM